MEFGSEVFRSRLQKKSYVYAANREGSPLFRGAEVHRKVGAFVNTRKQDAGGGSLCFGDSWVRDNLGLKQLLARV